MELMHIRQQDTLYKSYGSRNSAGVIWGHRGQKVIFTKMFFSFRLHGMVVGLMHIHQLDTFYKVMGLEIHPGSFGVTGVKKVHFHQKFCFFIRLHGMVMGLTHIHQLDTHYKRFGSRNSHRVIWGHWVKESFSPKMLFLLQFTWHNNENQAYSSTWHSLQKLRVWKFTRGHLGSQGSNGNFQKKKNGITCPCYIAW